jgi:hypothetical protein
VTFLVILVLYIGVAVSLALILRGMSRRFRAAGTALEPGGPYAPNEPPDPSPESTPSEPVGV